MTAGFDNSLSDAGELVNPALLRSSPSTSTTRRLSLGSSRAVDKIFQVVDDDDLCRLFDDLSKYVPGRLVKSVVTSKSGIIPESTQYPSFCKENGAVLLVDVSGFTKLSAAFAGLPGGCERFLVLMNDYFNALIGDISAYGGDVMCFAGDAVLVVFREENGDLQKAALNASLCAAKLVRSHSPYETPQGVTLYIHCGISIGELNFISLATEVVLGRPMADLDVAHSQTVKGECAVTKSVWDMIKTTDHPFDEVEQLDHGCMKIASTFSHAISRVRTGQSHVPLTRRINGKWMRQACQSLAPFVPMVVLENLVHGSEQWLAELRSPVIIFMTATVDGMASDTLNANTVEKIQAVVALSIQIICDKWEGFLRQITCDEKGFVLIFAFGMPGFAYADTAARAIAATVMFAETVRQIEASCKIGAGITTGPCYCGPIGSTDHRCEYVIAGDKVNLAARLCFKSNFGIWCEQAIYEQVSSQASLISISFHDRGTVRVKGKDEDIQVYEPKVLPFDGGTSQRSDPLEGLDFLPPSRERLFSRLLGFVKHHLDSSSTKRPSQGEIMPAASRGNTSHPAKEQKKVDQQKPIAVVVYSPPMSGKRHFLRHIFSGLQSLLLSTSVIQIHCIAANVPFSTLARLMAAVLPTTSFDINASALLNDPFACIPTSNIGHHRAVVDRALTLDLPEKIPALSQFYANLIQEINPNLLLVMHNTEAVDQASWAVIKKLRQSSLCNCSVVLSTIPVEDMKKTLPVYDDIFNWIMNTSETAECVTLPPMDLEDTIVIIIEVLKLKHVPEFLSKLILERSEGNIVYTLEMCRAILNQNLLTIQHGRVLTTAPTPELLALLPNSMIDMISAMIESYPFKHQIVLKIASAFGREFPEHMVAGVSADFGLQDKFEVHAILETLKVDKLIVRHGPELWRFRHTTHQEVAYGRILLAQRYDFHLSIAKKLQKVFGDNGTGSQAEHWARTIQLADTAQLFMNDKDLQMAYQQLKKGADFAASAGNVETAHEMYELAWLCFQKQSVMVERDILFETILLMGFLKTLDEMELAVATNKKAFASKEAVTKRLFDIYDHSDIAITSDYFRLIISEASRLRFVRSFDDAISLLEEAQDMIEDDSNDGLTLLLHIYAAILQCYLEKWEIESLMQVSGQAYSLWQKANKNVVPSEIMIPHPLCTVGPLCFMTHLLRASLADAKNIEEEILTAVEELSPVDKAYMLANIATIRLLFCGPTLQTEVLVQEYHRNMEENSLRMNIFEPMRRRLYIGLRVRRHRRGQRLLIERERYLDELLYRLQHEPSSPLDLELAARCCVESSDTIRLQSILSMQAASTWRNQYTTLWHIESLRLKYRGNNDISSAVVDQLLFEHADCSAVLERQGRVLDSLHCAYAFARAVDELGISDLKEEAIMSLQAVLRRVGSSDVIIVEVIDKATRMLCLLQGQPSTYSMPSGSPEISGILRKYSEAFDTLMSKSKLRRRHLLSPEMCRRADTGRLSICRRRRHAPSPAQRGHTSVDGEDLLEEDEEEMELFRSHVTAATV